MLLLVEKLPRSRALYSQEALTQYLDVAVEMEVGRRKQPSGFSAS